jgi:hypothetical protein
MNKTTGCWKFVWLEVLYNIKITLDFINKFIFSFRFCLYRKKWWFYLRCRNISDTYYLIFIFSVSCLTAVRTHQWAWYINFTTSFLNSASPEIIRLTKHIHSLLFITQKPRDMWVNCAMITLALCFGYSMWNEQLSLWWVNCELR